jgi:hypothetical protein
VQYVDCFYSHLLSLPTWGKKKKKEEEEEEEEAVKYINKPTGFNFL